MEILEKIKSVSIFQGLSQEALEKIAALSHFQFYPKDSIVFSEGTPGNALYIIVSGKAVAEKQVCEDEECEFKILGVISEGNIFGEMALFDKQLRSATVRAKEDLNVLCIYQEDFQNFLLQDIKVASQILGQVIMVLSQRLRDTDRELVAIYETGKIIATVRSVPEMLKHILRELMHSLPEAEAGLTALWNEVTEEFDFYANQGFNREEIGEPTLIKSDPLAGKLLGGMEPSILTHYEGNKPGLEFASAIIAPLRTRNKMLGFVLLLNRKQEKAFDPSQLNLVSAVVSQTATALSNLGYQEEEKARQRLQQHYY